jgi:hypothetical protein
VNLDRDVDTDFLSVDADARVGDVIDLLGTNPPARVVIRETPGFGGRDDDEDDVFFVFDADAVAGFGDRRDALIGEMVAAHDAAPAPVVETIGGGDVGVDIASVVAGFATGLLVRRGALEGVLTKGSASGGGGAPRRARSRRVGAAPPAGEAAAAPMSMAVAVDYAKSVEIDTTASLLLRLTGDLEGTDVIPFTATEGDVVDVLVSPRGGFVVEGPAVVELTVGGKDEAPPPRTVELRATALGVGHVDIFVFRDRSPLGALTITPEVVAAGAGAGDQVEATARLDDVPSAEADLELLILEQTNAKGRPELRYWLSARAEGLKHKPFGPVELATEPREVFNEHFREIEKLPLKTEQDREGARERLEAIGSSLFRELLPEDLRALLWSLRERVETVWIETDEPWVPWELLRLEGVEGGAVVEGEFLCEAFALTRFIPGTGRHPSLRLSNLGLIVPGDSGLDYADDEAEMVRGLARDGRTVVDVPATYLEVRRALESGRHDGLHFCGHGTFPDRQNPDRAVLELENRGTLKPSDIAGAVRNLGLTEPLVFLNACQAGRQARGLTGAGGWARRLLDAGAGAFVAAHWEVDDERALAFATRFYERLDAGATIAAAARDARMAIREGGDPTWLAYTVYGDPGATLA